MDDELTLYLTQRATLLESDDADLAQLKQHDRKLLAALDQGTLDSPLAQREGADEVLLQVLESDIPRNTLLLEARAKIWPGELSRVQQLMLSRGTHTGATWWLAAHYSWLLCPEGFPEEWQHQVWAAQALCRRGQVDLAPEPWRDWIQAMQGQVPVQEVASTLWEVSEGELWEQWLSPLLAVADPDTVSALINWLATRVDDQVLIQMMGRSCQSRFLPWLASIRHNDDLKEAALREVRWLTGGQKQRHQGYQCWGEPLCEEVWPQLFQRVPLGFRDRLWHWCAGAVQGAPTSLQGGQWCAGS